MKKTWHHVRQKEALVLWRNLVWFPKAIPKHSLITWLAMNNRLLTKARLQKRGYSGSVHCVLCNRCTEDLQHLFFGCSYSATVWKEVLNISGNIRAPCQWSNEVQWAGRNLIKEDIIECILKASLGTIYGGKGTVGSSKMSS